MLNLPVRHRQRGMARPRHVGDVEDVRDQMEQLFEELLGAPPPDGAAAVWTPPVDIEETDDAWLVEAELPGVKKDEVTVELNDSELVIRGEVKERERAGILRRRTRRVGEFEYRVTLPSEVDAERVEANLDGGVLTVRVPKSARAQPRRVEIRGG